MDWGAPVTVASTASVAVAAPPGARLVAAHDGTYTYQPSLAAAGKAAGFRPLRSTLQPDGFTLRAVATRTRRDPTSEALQAADTAAGARRAPQGPNEIDLLYARGLTWFTIAETCIAGDPQAAARIAGLVRDTLPGQLSEQSETLQYGAFTGRDAYTWYSPGGPVMVVAGKRYVVTVRGGITRDDLLSLAEGLEPL